MANNNESSPQKEELVKVEAEKDVIESSATHSDSTQSGAAEKKSSGNGLLWFVVIILFLMVLGMAGAGYWYYMQQQSASKSSESALQTTASQLNAIERERADIVASIDKVMRTNQALESTVADLKAQNEKLTLQSEIWKVADRPTGLLLKLITWFAWQAENFGWRMTCAQQFCCWLMQISD